MNNIHIFDLDGTLINSMEYYASGMKRVLEENNIPVPENLVDIVTPLGYSKTALYYQSLGLNKSFDDIIRRMEEILVYEYTNNIKLKPFVKDYLLKLKAQNDRLFVLTASPHIVTDVCLQKNGVYDLFEKVWSVEDFGIPKTKTELFCAVADTLDVNTSDIFFYDDNLTAITTAAAAGCYVYGVFDCQSDSERQQAVESCDKFIDSFEELL